MSNHTPQERKRMAHTPNHNTDLSQKITKLRTIWKDTSFQNRATSMKQVAIQKIKQQQLKQNTLDTHTHKNKSTEKPKMSKNQPTRHFAKKYPERTQKDIPPITFYQTSRPFESRPALATEEKIRLDAIHQICNTQETRYLRKYVKN